MCTLLTVPFSQFFLVGEFFLFALLKFSIPYVFPTMQCQLHFIDYDIQLEALLSGSFSVSYEMLLIS